MPNGTKQRPTLRPLAQRFDVQDASWLADAFDRQHKSSDGKIRQDALNHSLKQERN